MSPEGFLISAKGVFYSALRIFQQPPAEPPLLYIIATIAGMVSFLLILPFNNKLMKMKTRKVILKFS